MAYERVKDLLGECRDERRLGQSLESELRCLSVGVERLGRKMYLELQVIDMPKTLNVRSILVRQETLLSERCCSLRMSSTIEQDVIEE